MVTQDIIRSFTITVDAEFFDRLLKSSGTEPAGPFIASALEFFGPGATPYLRSAGDNTTARVARLQVRDGLLRLSPIR